MPNPATRRIIVTTTATIKGKRISQYLGIVTAGAVLGANIFRDMFAAVRAGV
jgi:uncharacterized protein YbjQ (UPF0145 family)